MLQTDEIAAFKSLGTGQVSDAMEMLGLRRAVISGFRFVAPPDTNMVGTALTIRQAPKHHPAEKSERLVKHGEVAASMAKAGEVIVIDACGRTDIGTWGENHSTRCLSRGVAGLLVSGCIRDAASIRKFGFPVFCLGFSPIKSQWDLETVAINETVTIADVQIRPGDIIFGDEDGVLVIPFDVRAEVLAKATDIRRREEADNPLLTAGR